MGCRSTSFSHVCFRHSSGSTRTGRETVGSFGARACCDLQKGLIPCHVRASFTLCIVGYPSQKEIAEVCGVSYRTLYNRFGRRTGTPALRWRKRS